ncbi:MAG: hypothetical protein ACR2MQ_16195 [Gemmatimonadaceae bacterium]
MSGRLGKDFAASLGTPRFVIPVVLVIVVAAVLFWFIRRAG